MSARGGFWKGLVRLSAGSGAGGRTRGGEGSGDGGLDLVLCMENSTIAVILVGNRKFDVRTSRSSK